MFPHGRLVCEESGDNFNPIPSLRETPMLSLEDAVVKAREDPLLRDVLDVDTASVHVRSAYKAARKLLREQPNDALSLEEIAAIHMYTQESPVHRVMNQRLRDTNRALLSAFLPFVKLLLSALHKLPPATQQTILYRAAKKDLGAMYKVDDEKTWWEFSTCSNDNSIFQKDAVLGSQEPFTILCIETCHAYDIQRYSANPIGNEFVLPPGTELEVLAVHSSESSLSSVQLKQLQYIPLFKADRQSQSQNESVSSAAAPSNPTASPSSSSIAPSSAPIPIATHAPSLNVHINEPSFAPPPSTPAPSLTSMVPVSRESSHMASQGSTPATKMEATVSVADTLAALRMHAEDPAALQECGSNLLIALVGGASIESILEGGLSDIVAGLRRHAADRSTAFCLTELLLRLMESDAHIVALVGAEGEEAIAAAMQAHASVPQIQAAGCGLLRKMTRSKAGLERVAAVEGIRAIISAMGRHPTVAGVAEHGCAALSNLAAEIRFQSKVTAQGGIMAVLGAMHVNAAHAGVQQYGCMALWNLARGSSENQREIAGQGGVEAVVAAMDAWTDNVCVLESGCGALLNIAFTDTAIQESARAKGGVGLIEKTLQLHPGSGVATAALVKITTGQ